MNHVITSHYKIFDYWKTKYITEDGAITDDENEAECAVVDDWGEPTCWACGKPVKKIDKDLHYAEWVNADDFKSIWDHKTTKHDLNRCHIIPAMLGGADVPENLFLMCEECHYKSPDTRNPYNFFRWVLRRKRGSVMGKRNVFDFMSEIDKELHSQGFPTSKEIFDILITNGNEKTMAVYGGDEQSGFIEFLRHAAGLHLNYIVESTLISTIVDWFKSMYLDVALIVKEE